MGSNFVIVLAAKDLITLDDMIQVQAHNTMDKRRKKCGRRLMQKPP